MPESTWSKITASLPSDPRWYTTPAGMVAGLALTRALVPKARRNPATYALGAGAGGVAGFGAGTLLQAQMQSPQRVQTQQNVSKVLAADPEETVAALGGDRAAAAETANQSLQAHYQAQPAVLTSATITPEEINAGKLYLQQETAPSSKGLGTGIGAIAGGAATPVVTRLMKTRNALKALQEKTLKDVPVGTPVMDTVKQLGKNQLSRFAGLKPQVIKGTKIGVGAAVLGTGASLVGRKLGLIDSAKKRFEESQGWQMRADYLRSKMRWERESLDEGTMARLQAAWENAQEKSSELKRSAHLRSLLEF